MKLQPLKGRSAKERRDFNSERFPATPKPTNRLEVADVFAALDKRARKNARDVREGRCS